ncbi:hypothetical protein M2114_001476 [Aurantimicrobium minutum]|uniref:Uncharacterized protein n=1 Tax=Aurantimicrobium photophilum TaxID=1987356 RepID=A0A2Z3S0W7_9MICO|nr:MULTISPECIES: hypothetical protein [Aurantimicrobium]AWR20728.1 hypothetical protein AURMO_00105 [Aurantimicrobium photophilum]MDH6207597.1 hypothetical protein [Aurantimicrobium minutum]MDH6277763.1 hypothetical protein [Aurantimicrobium minutum]MDH6409576.1 hypothetical protein [Aurantimicrobium minutum]MDH6425359.1 hypothetical protein [Aurantimicrobium minutum]
MTEREFLELWNKNRQQIVVSQMAPTFLLIVTVGLITLGLAGGPLFLSLATLGILLASGILGALVQYASATEAMAVAADLALVKSPSAASRQVVKFAPWLNVVRFVTPAIFTLIFLLLASILLMG